MLHRNGNPVLTRFAFWLCVALAVTMALLPKPPQIHILDQFGDKFEHMLAFATMAVLAALGFPRAPRLLIIERLSFLGALIEVGQSIPSLHRDCDIRDWVADMVGICAVLLVMQVIGLSRQIDDSRGG